MASLGELMSVRPGRGGSVAPSEGGTTNERGVYITPESLTFPAASGVAISLLTVANLFAPGANTSLLWQAGVSIVLGALIYVASLKPDLSFGDKVVGGAVAALNTVLLFGAVAGVLTLATQTVPS